MLLNELDNDLGSWRTQVIIICGRSLNHVTISFYRTIAYDMIDSLNIKKVSWTYGRWRIPFAKISSKC